MKDVKTNEKPNFSDETIYNVLKEAPDFDRFPLPKSWYDIFKLPPPKIPTIREALKSHYETQLAYLNSPTTRKIEVRPPAEGGVRPLIDAPVPEVKVYHDKTLEEIDLSGNIVENGETASSEESK